MNTAAISGLPGQTTVYVLDDEPDMLALLSSIVRLSGLEVHGFELACSLFNQVSDFTDGSLLILDLQMPDMDGVEVIRHIGQLDNRPSLVLVSGQDKSVLLAAEKLARAHHIEVLGSLQKPLSIGHLRSLLEQYAPVSRAPQNASIVRDSPELTARELRQALDEDQLVMHYQPQVELVQGTDSRHEVESLVRWQHPQRGLIYPDQFLPLAARHGWMGDVTSSVLGKVMQQQRRWLDQGLRIHTSVNVAASDVTSLVLPEYITELLQTNRLETKMLTLEVTETELIDELTTSLDVLTRLRLKGIGLSVDDFGTGYSSLSQLYRLPFTELKIDRSFVTKMCVDAEALAIVRACIMLGEQFGMRVIAEGVEDQQTWDQLQQLGCDSAQGYFIARPMAASELPRWLTKSANENGRTIQRLG